MYTYSTTYHKILYHTIPYHAKPASTFLVFGMLRVFHYHSFRQFLRGNPVVESSPWTLDTAYTMPQCRHYNSNGNVDVPSAHIYSILYNFSPKLFQQFPGQIRRCPETRMDYLILRCLIFKVLWASMCSTHKPINESSWNNLDLEEISLFRISAVQYFHYR